MSRHHSRRDPAWERDRDEEEENEEETGHRRHGRRHHHHSSRRASNSYSMDSTSLRIIGAIGGLTLLAAIIGIGVVANSRMQSDWAFNGAVAKLKKDCYEQKMTPIVDSDQGVFFCAKEINSIHALR